MDSDPNQNIIDKIHLWASCADKMSLQTTRLKEEICRTFHGTSQTPGAFMCKILPSITIFRNNVYCDGMMIPLAGKGRAIELFKAFLRRPLHAFTREELVEEIYGLNTDDPCSQRLTLAMAQNTIKLISRTRVVAERAVNAGSTKWIEWFAYDAERHLWSFYRLTNAYLLAKQNSIMGLQSSSPGDPDELGDPDEPDGPDDAA